MNALLSFLYVLLSSDCQAACEGIGLDPQSGSLPVVRPGRPALALNLSNCKQRRAEHFEMRTPGSESAKHAVLLNESGRKPVLSAYNDRKQEETVHPFLKDRVPLGLLPHLQARLLARRLRGDLPDEGARLFRGAVHPNRRGSLRGPRRRGTPVSRFLPVFSGGFPSL
ncbi:MAG: CRISPR-associated endonuclease Cas1 [Cytophagales bacterium]|nr:CRISPR-associated endonuclease Cas1 [Armatimonadota bacterium]